MTVTKTITRETEGKNQLGEDVGKPKPGDIVKVHYSAWRVKNGKKDAEILDTRHIGPMVSFKVTKDDNEHTGLYKGLNEVVRNMNLGEEADVYISSDSAFGETGLHRYYNPEMGFLKSQVGILGTQMPNDPNAPDSHKDRNPLCVAYVGVQAGQDVILKSLALMQIGNHRRELPSYSCCDCIVASITGAFGLNSGTF